MQFREWKVCDVISAHRPPRLCDSPLPLVVSFANWLSVFAVRRSARPGLLLVCYFQRLSFRGMYHYTGCNRELQLIQSSHNTIWRHKKLLFENSSTRSLRDTNIVRAKAQIYLLDLLSVLKVMASHFLSMPIFTPISQNSISFKSK